MTNIVENVIENRTCKQCMVEKPITEFRPHPKGPKMYYARTCKQCIVDNNREYKHQYYIDNKEELQAKNKANYEENKEERKKYSKQYYEENKEEILAKQKEYNKENPGYRKEYQKEYSATHKEEKRQLDRQYYENNKADLKIKNRGYYEANKQTILAKKKKYAKENKIQLRAAANKRKKERRQNDPIYAIKSDASREVAKKLKISGNSKNGESSSKYFPWTDEELIAHIECLFSHPNNLTPDGKVWMTRENRGVYNPETWKDDDPTTWTWQIDHIIPHSEFHYETMDCEEFRKCWELLNIRPLSAKQNIRENKYRSAEQIAAIKESIYKFLNNSNKEAA